MDKNTIYNLASADVHTDSYSTRNTNGTFNFSNGLFAILSNKKFEALRTHASTINTLRVRKKDLLQQMVQLEAPFENDVQQAKEKIIQTQKDYEMLSAKTGLLEEQIKEEEKRLLVRGNKLPDFEEAKPKVTRKPKIEKSKWNSFVQTGKKWLIVLLFGIILETFFGLAQFDFLSEYKSNIAIALRIGASALLIITLHWAEYRYKEHHAKQFKYYIIFGIIVLCVNLFLPLVLNYFFQDSLTVTEEVSGWGALNETTTDIASEETETTSFLGFLNRFDFIPALFAILIFLLMLLLDRSKKKEEDEVEASIFIEPNLPKEENILFKRLVHLRKEEARHKAQLEKVEKEINSLSHNSSGTILQIKNILLQTKEEVEKTEDAILNISNKIDVLLADVTAHIKVYETDFKSIIKTEVASQFVDFFFPNQRDIQSFYKLNSEI